MWINLSAPHRARLFGLVVKFREPIGFLFQDVILITPQHLNLRENVLPTIFCNADYSNSLAKAKPRLWKMRETILQYALTFQIYHEIKAMLLLLGIMINILGQILINPKMPFIS